MASYLRLVGWTLLTMSIIHGRTNGRWRELHAIGLTLATISIAGAEGR